MLNKNPHMRHLQELHMSHHHETQQQTQHCRLYSRCPVSTSVLIHLCTCASSCFWDTSASHWFESYRLNLLLIAVITFEVKSPISTILYKRSQEMWTNPLLLAMCAFPVGSNPFQNISQWVRHSICWDGALESLNNWGTSGTLEAFEPNTPRPSVRKNSNGWLVPADYYLYYLMAVDLTK